MSKPRDSEAFPLARIWASLQDWERTAITEYFAGHQICCPCHSEDPMREAGADLNKQAYQWTKDLQDAAGFVPKPQTKKRKT